MGSYAPTTVWVATGFLRERCAGSTLGLAAASAAALREAPRRSISASHDRDSTLRASAPRTADRAARRVAAAEEVAGGPRHLARCPRRPTVPGSPYAITWGHLRSCHASDMRSHVVSTEQRYQNGANGRRQRCCGDWRGGRWSGGARNVGSLVHRDPIRQEGLRDSADLDCPPAKYVVRVGVRGRRSGNGYAAQVFRLLSR